MSGLLSIHPNPFRPWEHERIEIVEGLTLEVMLDEAGVPLEGREFLTTWIGDQEVLPPLRRVVRPKAGVEVTVRVRPGDGGGGGGKDPLRTLLTIGVLVAAIYAPYLFGISGTFGGALLSAGVGIGGMALVNAIAPIPIPRLDRGDRASTSTNLLRGIKNEFKPFGVVPAILGRHRMAPLFGAKPYTEIAGNERFLRLLYVWGYGPLTFNDDPFRIGDTPLAEFEDVEVETRGAYGDAVTENKALSFDGSGDEVAVGDVHGFEGTAPFTFECWFRPGTQTKSFPRLVSKERSTPTRDGWLVFYHHINQTIGFERFLAGGSNNVTSGITMVTGQAYHVAVIFTGTQLSIAIDGIEEAPSGGTLSLIDNAESLKFAISSPVGAGAFVVGEMDDIRIWNVARTPDEIRDNMGVRLAGTESGLVGYWRMDKVVGSTLPDQTSGGNDGAITGAVQVASPFLVVDNQPMDLFPSSIDEQAVDVELTQAKGWVTRTSENDADELSVDLFFAVGIRVVPGTGNKTIKRAKNISFAAPDTLTRGGFGSFVGLGYSVGDFVRVSGSALNDGIWEVGGVTSSTLTLSDPLGLVTVETEAAGAKIWVITRDIFVQVEYSPTEADTWTVVEINVAEAGAAAGRFNSLRWRVDRGQYDVRLKRLTPDASQDFFNLSSWIVLRTITNEEPVNMAGIVKTALRIRQTDQLNGILDTFNGIPQSVVRTWDGSSWTLLAPSSNPADLIVHVLQGVANPKPRTDAQMDFVGLLGLRDRCVTEGWEYNGIVDYEVSVSDVMAEVAASAKAGRTVKDGKWGVVEDIPQTVPRQHFTPRNSWGFTGSKTFRRLPHALRVRFLNELKDWDLDEITVYDDGFDEATATLFETMEQPGVTNPDLQWRLMRYQIAQARLRPELFWLQTDVQHIMCTRGDLVRVTHDVPLWGLGTGRVKSVQDDGEFIVSITLDEQFTTVLGKSYNMRFALPDGTSLLIPLVTTDETSNTVTVSGIHQMTAGPFVGDKGMHGETGLETVENIVLAIEPADDMTARIVMVNAAPAVHDADKGTIPDFDPKISTPPGTDRPYILSVRSDSFVMAEGPGGVLMPRIVIVLGATSTRSIIGIQSIELASRILDDVEWISQLFPFPSVELDVRGVVVGETYELRARYVFPGDAYGEWTRTWGEIVIGKTDLLPDVGGMFLNKNKLTWLYPAPPPDFAGFRLRQKPTSTNVQWEEAVDMHDGLLSNAAFDLAGFPSALSTTFLVKAVDNSGNESANAATLFRGLGDRALDIILLSEDHRALGWPGDIVNGTPSGGDLLAGTSAVFWATQANSLFWDEVPVALFWTVESWGDMLYTLSFVPPHAGVGGDMFMDVEADGPWLVEYRTAGESVFWGEASTTFWDPSGAALFWSEGYTDWFRWPGLLEARRQEYQVRVSVLSSRIFRGVLRELEIGAAIDVKGEIVEDFVLAAAGDRLPLTKTFAKILSIGYTIQGVTTAVDIRTIDKDPVRGPLVQPVESDGTTGALAIIDARVQGY